MERIKKKKKRSVKKTFQKRAKKRKASVRRDKDINKKDKSFDPADEKRLQLKCFSELALKVFMSVSCR